MSTALIRTYVTAQALAHQYRTATTARLRVRLRRARDQDDSPLDGGFSTLEWVIIGVGVAGIAIAAVAAFTAAVTRRTDQL
jgi:hypothetical protein